MATLNRSWRTNIALLKRFIVIFTLATMTYFVRHQLPEVVVLEDNEPEEFNNFAHVNARQLKLASSYSSSELQRKRARQKITNANGSQKSPVQNWSQKSSVQNWSQKSSVQKIPSRRFPTEPPIILVWTASTYFMQDKEKHLEFTTETECGKCRVTTERSLIGESIAVVLFYPSDVDMAMDVPDPGTRRLDQNYVFWSRETPAKLFPHKSGLEEKRFDSLFNLTMTMFYKSDVRTRFGTIQRVLEVSIKENFGGNFETLMKPKRKIAVWFVSACYRLNGDVKRMEYARSLQKAGLKLDKFGSCFHARAPKRLVKLVSEYKFYLAFENSIHCPNYVTEKLWRNSLEAGLVPIVWGPTRADVELVAPPDSFIFAEDFKTPSDLVKHINYLDKNDAEYLKYHQWRNTPLDTIPPDIHSWGTEGDFCRLCQRLVQEEHPPKSISSISKWFYEGYPDDQCLQPPPKMTLDEKRSLVDF